MLTFQDQYKLYQQISQDYTAGGLSIAKRDINEGGAMFLNRLGRKFNKEYLTTDLVDGQQYYQMSTMTLRISAIRVKNGDNWYTPLLVTSEEEWNDLNSFKVDGNNATHYFIRGFNEIGLYPIPNIAVEDGLEVSHEPQHIELTKEDYLVGSVTVDFNSRSIVHSASGFDQSMVGRWFQTTDGTDGKWYRIASFVSNNELLLENYYEGLGGQERPYRIGEVMKIPNAYQDAPVYYALDRFYQTQNDQKTASAYEARFNMKIKSAKETYGRSTSRMGIKTGRGQRRANWIDLTPPVQYP